MMDATHATATASESQPLRIDTHDGNCLAASSSSPQPARTSVSTATENLGRPPFRVKSAMEIREGSGYYNMLSPVRGICLIINNFTFQDPSWNRDGSEQEGEMLEELFIQLGFDVRHLKNRSAKEIDDDFEAASLDENNLKYDSFVGIILSHGNVNNIIHGVDGILSLDQILERFNNENCPLLISKPKMFFIQSCRGNKRDLGVTLTNVADALQFLPQAQPNINRLPTWTDTVVCYSTIDGFASMRNILTGSWFGDALIKVFCERAHDTELHQLLMLVNGLLSQRESTDIQAKQSLEIVYRGWNKQLYFNPGLYNA